MFLNRIFSPHTLLPVLLPCLLLLRAADPGAVLGHEEAYPTLTLRVQTFGREKILIENPIRWPQFDFLLPEGSRVREGDRVFTFDLTPIHDRLRGVERNLAQTRIDIEVQLNRIQQRIIGLQDQKATLEADRAILLARRNYLLALPRPEDVAVARGRLDVALRNLEALTADRDTAADRLQRNLVAPVTLENAERDLALQQARTDFARLQLETVSKPAHPHTLRINKLQIENLDLEIAKLTREITSQEEILRIETRATERRIDDLLREKTEVETELQNGELLAPVDGVLVYTSRLKREIASGGKPSRGMALAEIPKPASIALQGHIPEDQRSLFTPGDPARIRLNPLPDQEFTGRILSISPLPRDISEIDRRTQGDASAETGVKVFDIILVFDTLPENIPFGIYGTAELRAADPVIGPSVPLHWTRIRDGKHHLSLNGTFTPVNGVPVATRFLLREDLPLDSISPDGEWPRNPAREDLTALSGDRVTASGELTPLESVAVNVPSVRAWDIRVSKLAPEDTWVETGDILAELDSERLTTRLREAEADLINRTSQREAAEEELAQRRREAEFQIARARNQLEIQRLEFELLTLNPNPSPLHQARLDHTTARIQAEAARRELDRARATPELTAPLELRRRERDLTRRTLNLEQAELQLALAQQQPAPLSLSQARLRLIQQETRLAELESRTRRELAQSESHYRRRLRIERSRTERLADRQSDIEALVIKAPAPGLLKYENLWDGITVAKLRPGMSVWGGSPLLSLSDSNRMVVRVQVSERHIRFLKPGMAVQVRIPSEGAQLWTGTVRRLSEILVPAAPPDLRSSPYTNLEPPLEHVIDVEVVLRDRPDAPLKPGAVAHVIFPFGRNDS